MKVLILTLILCLSTLAQAEIVDDKVLDPELVALLNGTPTIIIGDDGAFISGFDEVNLFDGWYNDLHPIEGQWSTDGSDLHHPDLGFIAPEEFELMTPHLVNNPGSIGELLIQFFGNNEKTYPGLTSVTVDRSETDENAEASEIAEEPQAKKKKRTRRVVRTVDPEKTAKLGGLLLLILHRYGAANAH